MVGAGVAAPWRVRQQWAVVRPVDVLGLGKGSQLSLGFFRGFLGAAAQGHTNDFAGWASDQVCWIFRTAGDGDDVDHVS